LVWALPAAAQERGTMEFGGFASAASFDNNLSLKTGYGGGVRFGMFLGPSWALEFEDAEMRASRPNGLKDVNVGILAARLVATPFRSGPFSLLAGVGAGVSTETTFLHSYGVDALLGARFALSDNAAFRVDGVYDYLEQQDGKKYLSGRAGFTFYRKPKKEVRTVTVTVATPAPPPVYVQHEDSVSAGETRRLRERDVALRALRDSLNNAPVAATAPSGAASEVRIPNRKDPLIAPRTPNSIKKP
jgi:hypothetical protein